MDKRRLPFSEERKRLISERTRLAMARPEVKAKVDFGRRKPRSEEAKSNLRAAQQRPEVREKISRGNLGKKRTLEQKERHRKAILAWWGKHSKKERQRMTEPARKANPLHWKKHHAERLSNF